MPPLPPPHVGARGAGLGQADEKAAVRVGRAGDVGRLAQPSRVEPGLADARALLPGGPRLGRGHAATAAGSRQRVGPGRLGQVAAVRAQLDPRAADRDGVRGAARGLHRQPVEAGGKLLAGWIWSACRHAYAPLSPVDSNTVTLLASSAFSELSISCWSPGLELVQDALAQAVAGGHDVGLAVLLDLVVDVGQRVAEALVAAAARAVGALVVDDVPGGQHAETDLKVEVDLGVGAVRGVVVAAAVDLLDLDLREPRLRCAARRRCRSAGLTAPSAVAIASV